MRSFLSNEQGGKGVMKAKNEVSRPKERKEKEKMKFLRKKTE
jgi:hypothetical protein